LNMSACTAPEINRATDNVPINGLDRWSFTGKTLDTIFSNRRIYKYAAENQSYLKCIVKESFINHPFWKSCNLFTWQKRHRIRICVYIRCWLKADLISTALLCLFFYGKQTFRGQILDHPNKGFL